MNDRAKSKADMFIRAVRFFSYSIIFLTLLVWFVTLEYQININLVNTHLYAGDGAFNIHPGKSAYEMGFSNFGWFDRRWYVSMYSFPGPRFSWTPRYAKIPYWLSIVTAVLAVAATHAWRAIRKRFQRKEGTCVDCGYDLTGNQSGHCPECNTPIIESLHNAEQLPFASQVSLQRQQHSD